MKDLDLSPLQPQLQGGFGFGGLASRHFLFVSTFATNPMVGMVLVERVVVLGSLRAGWSAIC
jgi:hypothetical protein